LLNNVKNILNNPSAILKYLSNINYDNSIVYLAGSLMEGFGNSTSDIDIYVICDEIPTIEIEDDIPQSLLLTEQNLVRNVIHEGIRLDFEYWTWSEFNRAILKLNSLNFKTNEYIERISEDEFDLLHRLKFGKPIVNSERFEQVYNGIEFDNLGHYRVAVQNENYQGLLEDLQGAFLSKDYGSAFFLSRLFLDRTMTSFLAANGETNPNSKWLYRKALRYQERTGDFQLLENYLQLQSQPYNEDTINELIKKIISYGQSLNIKSQNKLKVKQTT
jgi:predicted nucleotidyltransferase